MLYEGNEEDFTLTPECLVFTWDLPPATGINNIQGAL